MGGTFAVLNLPQATPPDPQTVPVPDDLKSEHGKGYKWPVQDEPKGAQEEADDYKFYNALEDVQEEYYDNNVEDMRHLGLEQDLCNLSHTRMLQICAEASHFKVHARHRYS
eukprot:3848427-Amphidinium_carterae.1